MNANRVPPSSGNRSLNRSLPSIGKLQSEEECSRLVASSEELDVGGAQERGLESRGGAENKAAGEARIWL